MNIEYTCPICGCVDVKGYTDLYAISSAPVQEISHPLIPSLSYGLLMASCSKCGLVAFFDPVVVGLYPDSAINDILSR